MFVMSRCQLPTGKIYWLCDKHSAGPRIAKLSTESTSTSEIGKILFEEDTKLRENLEQSSVYKKKKTEPKPKFDIELPPCK